MSRKPVLVALAIGVGIIGAGVGGCAYNEALGRNQLVFIDDSALIQQSQVAWAETLRTQKLSNNATQNARVRRVGDRIVQAANLTNRHWEYAVFDDSTPNAFVLPSGHMGVTTGLLAIAKNDDQLAAVIGHEVGHVVARHAAERASTTQTTGLILGAVQSQAGDYGQAVQALGGMGAQLGVLLPFSRSHELEADRLGVDYMVAAGYKASESLNLWRAMAEGRQSGTPEFASTHPSDQTRLMQLQQYIASRGWN
ncbi:M48 family metallopeptidase [Brevundimonas diminuta]|uniref:M48 family metallopeptidase n=1 Tax=Brevundimonas diminuta TaxID=293 RepID=UPI003208DE47